MEETKAKSTRGFASMDKEKQTEIARKGGISAHAKGTAHQWTSEEARAAGLKGGRGRQKQVKENKEEAAAE
jgi:general stress protein YciG